MVRTLLSLPRASGQGTRISQATRSNLPHPPQKKIISKLNFRAVNFFFLKSRSEFKFKSTLSRCESSGGSWLRLGIRVGGSLCERGGGADADGLHCPPRPPPHVEGHALCGQGVRRLWIRLVMGLLWQQTGGERSLLGTQN